MTKSQELIRQLKETRKRKNITYNAILDELTVNGAPLLSMTTLRRVFANDSESKASSFNYEETLLPISDALKRITGDEHPHKKEIDSLNNMIRVQGDAIDRLMAAKEHLLSRVEFLTQQITEKDALIARLIDRLDQKDEIIRQFLTDLKQKDEILQRMMAKHYGKENENGIV